MLKGGSRASEPVKCTRSCLCRSVWRREESRGLISRVLELQALMNRRPRNSIGGQLHNLEHTSRTKDSLPQPLSILVLLNDISPSSSNSMTKLDTELSVCLIYVHNVSQASYFEFGSVVIVLGFCGAFCGSAQRRSDVTRLLCLPTRRELFSSLKIDRACASTSAWLGGFWVQRNASKQLGWTRIARQTAWKQSNLCAICILGGALFSRVEKDRCEIVCANKIWAEAFC